jgi:hypothetical protein
MLGSIEASSVVAQPASFQPVGSKREMLRLALRELHRTTATARRRARPMIICASTSQSRRHDYLISVRELYLARRIMRPGRRRWEMRSFVLACIAVAVIATASAAILSVFQESATAAFST